MQEFDGNYRQDERCYLVQNDHKFELLELEYIKGVVWRAVVWCCRFHNLKKDSM